MKKLLTSRRNLALTLLLGGWACTGAAQTLGSPAGGAWIGQPLELNIPARFASADGADECVQADVFYGDTRLGAATVRTTVTGVGEQKQVRVEASAPIDEPIVTVSLRAGCRNTVTRNYTLLPEMPSEPVLAALARPAAVTLGASAAPVPLRMAQATSRPASPRVARAQARATVAQAEAAPRMRVAKAKAPRREAAVAMAGAHLRLDPMEIDARTLLRVSAKLSDTMGDPARRATAALLWQAVNADPQEVLRTSAMLQKLEMDLAQLRQSALRTQSDMASLRGRLDEAQPWYLSPVLAQVLGLLVLATAAAAGVLWYRTRRSFAFSDPWYGVDARRDPQDSSLGAVPEAVVPQPVAAEPQPAPVVIPPRAEKQVTRRAVPVAATAAPAPVVPNLIEFELPQQPPRRATSGVLRVETLAATFDEVEFLASMGLQSDAMDVLKSYLQDSSNPAPLAFFELMRLCDEGEDATALPMVRRRYVQAFGMEAPRLEQVTAPVGLESRRDLCTRITKAWGRQEALDIIEEALFTVPKPGASLTLHAARDLLCLYDLGMALMTESAGSTGSGLEADAHPVAPWADAQDAQQAANSAAEAQGGYAFALDVDLNAAPEALPDSVPPPEVAPLLANLQAAAREQARKAQEDEDAFSAAVASDRLPMSRH
jgi:hypothetical protein